MKKFEDLDEIEKEGMSALIIAVEEMARECNMTNKEVIKMIEYRLIPKNDK